MLSAVPHEIPEWLAVLLCSGSQLAKAAGHKYVRKVPAGTDPRTGRVRYRYYYDVTGGRMLGHHEEIAEGSAFGLKHRGKEGHLHVTKVHDDGKVSVRHDESGAEAVIHRDVLADLLHREHAGKIQEAHARADRWVNRVSGKGQEKYARQKRDELHAHFGGKLSHHARVDLGRQAVTEDEAHSAMAFPTKRAAIHAATQIGLGAEYVKEMHPRAAAHRGVGKLGGPKKRPYVIANPGTHQTMTSEAFDAMASRKKGHNRDLARFMEEYQEKPKPEKDPDALPRDSKEVVRALMDASGSPDFAGADTVGLLDHMETLIDLRGRRELEKRIAQLPRNERVLEILAAAVRASKAKTWEELLTKPIIGQQSLVGFLSESQDLAEAMKEAGHNIGVRIPQEAQDRLEKKREAEEWARYAEERGIDPDDPSTWPDGGGSQNAAVDDDEDLPDWVTSDDPLAASLRGMMKGQTMPSTDLRKSLATRFDRAIPGARLEKGLASSSPAWGDPIEWAERFKGTPLHAEALECVLSLRSEMDNIERENQAKVESNQRRSQATEKKIADLREEQRKSWEGNEDFWQRRDACAKKHGDSMRKLETKLLELRKTEAERGAGAELQKSVGFGSWAPMRRVLRPLYPTAY